MGMEWDTGKMKDFTPVDSALIMWESEREVVRSWLENLK
jgi:hypothetical protein